MDRIFRLVLFVLEPIPGAKGRLDTLQWVLTLVGIGAFYAVPGVVSGLLAGALVGSASLVVLLTVALIRKDLEVETHLDDVKRVAEHLRKHVVHLRSFEVSSAELFARAGRTLLGKGLSQIEYQRELFEATPYLRKGPGQRFKQADIPVVDILNELDLTEVVILKYHEPGPLNSMSMNSFLGKGYNTYSLSPLGKRVLAQLAESSAQTPHT